MTDHPKPRPLIPSPEFVLPLPEAAARVVRLVRDEGPDPPAGGVLFTILYEASCVLALLRKAREQMAVGPYQVSGWRSPFLVEEYLKRLSGALRALLVGMGWGNLWAAHYPGAASEGGPAEGNPSGGVVYRNGQPLSDVGVFVQTNTVAPEPLLAAVERAARLLGQTLSETAVQAAALDPAAEIPPPAEREGAEPSDGLAGVGAFRLRGFTFTLPPLPLKLLERLWKEGPDGYVKELDAVKAVYGKPHKSYGSRLQAVYKRLNRRLVTQSDGVWSVGRKSGFFRLRYEPPPGTKSGQK